MFPLNNLARKGLNSLVGNLTIIGSDNSLSPGRRQAIIRKKRQWKCNRNSYIFIPENAFENVVSKLVAISSRPQFINLEPNIPLGKYRPIPPQFYRSEWKYLNMNMA